MLQYAVFGKVTKGDETLRKLEELPTRKEGIFVMVFFFYTLVFLIMSVIAVRESNYMSGK